jgi:hypothetical protein
MRSDLGRLDAAVEILPIGSFLKGTCSVSRKHGWRGALQDDMLPENAREHRMKLLRMAAAIALLTVPAYVHAQTPHINMLADSPSKTPEEIEADKARDKAYKDSLQKIPDAKVSSDPWGNVRSDAPKAAPAAKTTAAKSKAKTNTGSAAAN